MRIQAGWNFRKGQEAAGGKLSRSSLSTSWSLFRNSLRLVSSIRFSWLASVLTCTGLYRPTPRHLRNAPRILRTISQSRPSSHAVTLKTPW
jgi:hypothetical protein